MAPPSVVVPDDYAELARFLAAFPGDTHDTDFWLRRFRYWWEDNPAFAAGVPRGWVTRAETRITGFLGNVPTLFRSDGQDVRVFNATTWRVLPEHRSGSIGLYIAQLRACDAFACNTTASPVAAKVLDYLRFVSLPSVRSGRAHLLPLAKTAVARAFLRDREMPDLLKTLAGVPLGALALPAEARLRAASHGEARVVETADESFDELWERTKDRHRHTSVRSAERLRWLCFSNPDFRKTLVVHERRGILHGFGVFSDATWRGLRTLEAVDFWSDAAGERAAAEIVAETVRHARAAGYQLLVLREYSPHLTRLLSKPWFFMTTPETRRHYFGAGDRPPPAILLGDSYLSGLEGDLAV